MRGSRSRGPRALWWLGAAALIACFLGAWGVAYLLLPVHVNSDVPLYERYADAIADGALPYRDIAIEYPPAATGLFLLARGLEPILGNFERAFVALLLIAGIALLAAAAAILRISRAGKLRIAAALGLLALLPLVLGRTLAERYDLFPTTLVAWALAAQLMGRWRLTGVLLGIGTAAKLYPAALVPLFAILAFRAHGRSAATRVAVSWLVVVVTVWLPFIAFSPSGALLSLRWQFERPLQLESVGASLLQVAHQIVHLDIGIEVSYGSTNLGGDLPRLVSYACAAGGLTAAVVLLRMAARARGSEESTIVATAAMLALVIVFGKVLSPQYVVWLAPSAAMVMGPVGVAAGLMFTAAAIATNVLYPRLYTELILMQPAPTWLLAGRNALLVAFAALLMARLHRVAGREEASASITSGRSARATLGGPPFSRDRR